MYFIKVFSSIILTTALGFGGYAYWLMGEIRHQHEISTERALFDIANILASHLSAKVENGKIDTSDFDGLFQNLKKNQFEAVIYDFVVKNSKINVYVTDDKQKILYDSRSKYNVGAFMDWRDVSLTLKGLYGARSTEEYIDGEFSDVFYVGSPIVNKNTNYPPEINKIIGVVSVSKSTKSFNDFVFGGQDRIIFMIVIIFNAALFLALFFSYWLSRPIRGLIKYAEAIAAGESARPPISTSKEFQKLGRAFEKMRISIEKKEAVKDHVNDVTHALKSPLTAIKATAELVQDKIPKDKLDLFSNIETEANRASKLLDDLLSIAKLEAEVSLGKREKISTTKLFEETLQRLDPIIKNKKINIVFNKDNSKPIINGEKFLIGQVFENLLLNALDFSPIEGKILIESLREDNIHQIFLRDQGPGIPEYAKDKIFEKFYSLERPSGKKSTGLGLSFVKEALAFHNGKLELQPSTQEMPGANFKLSFYLK